MKSNVQTADDLIEELTSAIKAENLKGLNGTLRTSKRVALIVENTNKLLRTCIKETANLYSAGKDLHRSTEANNNWLDAEYLLGQSRILINSLGDLTAQVSKYFGMDGKEM